MASFTSVQTGNWNDGGTWGNTSPGVAGTDYPGVAADTATIAATHVVTYDAGDSVVAYGDIIISGTLTFPTGADSTLIIGTTNDITVNASGSFIAGTSTTPINAAYKCKIIFTQTTTDRVCFDSVNGATISVYGDLTYFDSTLYGELDSDWTSGQTLYLQGDMTNWPTEGYFCINKNTTYSAYATDSAHFSIASLTYDSGNDRTAVVINETAPAVTFNKDNYGFTGRVYLLDRNVFFGVETFSSPRELTVDMDQTIANDLIYFKGVEWRGFEDVGGNDYNHSMSYCTFSNMDQLWYTGHTYGTVTDCILYAVGGGVYGMKQGAISNMHCVGCSSAMSVSYGDIDGCVVIGAYVGISSHSVGIITATMASCDRCMIATKVTADITAYNCKQLTRGISLSRIAVAAYNVPTLDSFTSSDTIITGIIDNTGGGLVAGLNGGIIVFEGTLNAVIAAYSLGTGAFIAQNSVVDGVSTPYLYRSSALEIDSIFSGDANFETPPSGNDWALEFKPDTSQIATIFASMMPSKISKTAMLNTHTKATVSVFVKAWVDPRINDKGGLLISGLYNSTAVSGKTSFNAEKDTLASGSWVSIEIPLVNPADGFFEWLVEVRDDENIIILVDPVVALS